MAGLSAQFGCEPKTSQKENFTLRKTRRLAQRGRCPGRKSRPGVPSLWGRQMTPLVPEHPTRSSPCDKDVISWEKGGTGAWGGGGSEKAPVTATQASPRPLLSCHPPREGKSRPVPQKLPVTPRKGMTASRGSGRRVCDLSRGPRTAWTPELRAVVLDLSCEAVSLIWGQMGPRCLLTQLCLGATRPADDTLLVVGSPAQQGGVGAPQTPSPHFPDAQTPVSPLGLLPKRSCCPET